MPTLHIHVSGKVQGVFYRVNARDKALHLGITGWVRNTPDGRVEIMASGSEHSLFHFVEWCRRGPAKAKVEEVSVNTAPAQIFAEFTVNR